MNTPYEHEIEVAMRLVQDVGKRVADMQGRVGVDRKRGGEVVTDADRMANERICRGLSEAFPGDSICAEETVDYEFRPTGDRLWWVDPVDGTREFVDGRDDYAVMVGLAVKGEAVLGVVYQPRKKRMWTGVTGGEAYEWIEGEDKPRLLKTSAVCVSSEMRMAVSRSHRSAQVGDVVEILGIESEVPCGSVGVKVGLLLRCEADLYPHPGGGTKRWDTCAPEAILRAGGGQLTDVLGQPIDYSGREIANQGGFLASNGSIHEEILERLNPLLKPGR
ncbi:MAG: 3'(2'),5'-bisphosphate nucleotidase CysQ [Planctomycetota bacterium]|nr:3'(2'),5'-bisphosphate nucleotidase CysQ [Planctomycetota bacterium]